jgi:hypothetical protein
MKEYDNVVDNFHGSMHADVQEHDTTQFGNGAIDACKIHA